MKLTLKRVHLLDTCTIGELYINDVFFCHTLEDLDRGLDKSMPLSAIKAIKKKHETAIPTGAYKVINSFSPRFKTYLPLLLNVPGYDGIRIHAGNNAAHTSGCILVGDYNGWLDKRIINSTKTMAKLLSLLKAAEKKEEIIIEITK